MVSIAANLTESVVTSYHMTAADISTSTAILHQMAKAKPKNVKETETMLKVGLECHSKLIIYFNLHSNNIKY